MFLALLGDPEVSIGIPGTGGYNKTVAELLNYFGNSKINIIVITNKNSYNQMYHSRFSHNIDIYRIDFDAMWERNHNLLVDNIETIIKRVNDTIFFATNGATISLIHSFYWLSGFIAARIKSQYEIPFVHTVVSLSEDKLAAKIQPSTNRQRNFEACFLPLANLIFAITPQEIYTLTEKYNIPQISIILVGRSIAEDFSNAYMRKKKLQSYDGKLADVSLSIDDSWWANGAFLYVGRIVEIKGIKQIVAAWINAKKQFNINIPLWFVGGTPQQINRMRKQILLEYPYLTEYETNNQIVWWGNLNTNEISALIRKTHALIMHSCFEAGGRVIIEALSAGIPVIATPYGFAADYIFNGYNGFITEFNDIANLTKVMMKFSDQPYLSSVMGAAAHDFMSTIYDNWNYFKKHAAVYNSFIEGYMPSRTLNEAIIPKDLLSFKRRNCVTIFPYFSTDRETYALSQIISDKIGYGELTIVKNDVLHSDIFLYSIDNKKYYIKCFYHILTNRLSKVQYKNIDVLSAQEQVSRSIISSKFINISNVRLGDESNLLYIIPCYNSYKEIPSINALISLWQEMRPEDDLIELYSQMKFDELEEIIDSSKNPLINGLFCAEIAYRKLFYKYKLPDEINIKMTGIMKNEKAVAFGLNYGKGILGHIVQKNSTFVMLPAHSIYLGELGYDIAATFLQYNCDDIELWIKIKSYQNIVSSKRLDLWLLIVVYANEKENEYKKTIEYILNF